MSQFLFLTPQILLPFNPVTSQEFDLIRHKARASWQNETRWSDSSVTTYSGSYHEKQLDESVCSRLASWTAGQYKPGCTRTVLLNRSTYSPLFCGAGAQETKDVKGRFPDINGPLKNPFDVKHRVAHQIWYSADAPPALPNCRKSRTYTLDVSLPLVVRSKQPALKTQVNHKCVEKISKHVQWDSLSKVRSSADSETDQYSDCGQRGLLSLLF
ncbi:uncharacterized protein C4orf51 homolog [Cavia porcellus]|uniref:uncharacterized protein C4orf51 homolog n=1 Tax=Cavia porcellus TaxID=10141 RepID=UPI002FE0823C